MNFSHGSYAVEAILSKLRNSTIKVSLIMPDKQRRKKRDVRWQLRSIPRALRFGRVIPSTTKISPFPQDMK
jgi:hypothetical protein